MLRLIAPAVIALTLLPVGVQAQSVSATDCAAFWYGRDDFARRSRGLPRDPADLARAHKAEGEALREGGTAAQSAIEAGRGDMALIFEASIELNDGQSRNLQQSLTASCTAFTDALP